MLGVVPDSFSSEIVQAELRNSSVPHRRQYNEWVKEMADQVSMWIDSALIIHTSFGAISCICYRLSLMEWVTEIEELGSSSDLLSRDKPWYQI